MKTDGKIGFNTGYVFSNELFYSAPYKIGWCIKLTPTNPTSFEEELTSLMKGDTPEFIKWITNEIKRINEAV
ncbi:MAG: hypothetical protein ACW963_06535 [Candidatus Sifarchaeia archaeon]|jgi:hypothetical protein